jgi:hypothetical protein
MAEENVINLAKKLEAKRPHLRGTAICTGCRKEWEAVAHTKAPDVPGPLILECPACGAEKGIFKYHVWPPEKETYFECNCGNHLFMIQRNGILCIECGTLHARDI